MEYTNFYGREDELKLLEEGKNSSISFFLVLYGRRRVGKTALIQHFFNKHGGLYLVGRQESEKDQLLRISRQISLYFKDKLLEINPFQSWDAVFTYLFVNHPEIKVALDEFPYMVQSQPALPSILQDYWDQYNKTQKYFLIISGSSLTMMETFLGYNSPLYGRRTHQLLLQPLTFAEAQKFFPNCPIDQKIEFYAIFGGTPAYLEKLIPSKSIEENIREVIFPRNQFLYQDPIFVLREELSEPRLYFSIAQSIAKGNTRLNEIVMDTGLDKATVSKYLSVLQDLQYIERRVPITEDHPEKSRKGIYRLKDPYYCFWFRFIFPNNHLLEQNQDDYVLKNLILPQLNQYIGLQFEEICAQWIRTKYPDFVIGRWWDNHHELDLVALTPDRTRGMLIEVKWSELAAPDFNRIFTEIDEIKELINISNIKWDYVICCRSVKNMPKKMQAHHKIFTIERMWGTI
jgi:AAA+ ATPase superfamily predicted ATPase